MKIAQQKQCHFSERHKTTLSEKWLKFVTTTLRHAIPHQAKWRPMTIVDVM